MNPYPKPDPATIVRAETCTPADAELLRSTPSYDYRAQQWREFSDHGHRKHPTGPLMFCGADGPSCIGPDWDELPAPSTAAALTPQDRAAVSRHLTAADAALFNAQELFPPYSPAWHALQDVADALHEAVATVTELHALADPVTFDLERVEF